MDPVDPFTLNSMMSLSGFVALAANAVNTVAWLLPTPVWVVLACNSSCVDLKITYSPSPLNTNFIPSRVLKLGSPYAPPAQRVQCNVLKIMYQTN